MKDLAVCGGGLVALAGCRVEHLGIYAVGFLMMAWGIQKNGMFEGFGLRIMQLLVWGGLVWSLGYIGANAWHIFLR
ncbi:MAG: hypothetical protein V1489_01185 [Candidatus Liptonbacteria bacterium]